MPFRVNAGSQVKIKLSNLHGLQTKTIAETRLLAFLAKRKRCELGVIDTFLQQYVCVQTSSELNPVLLKQSQLTDEHLQRTTNYNVQFLTA